MTILDKEMRLQAPWEFTDCFYPVWSWRLDRFFNVIQSDCPHGSLIRSIFLRDGRRDAIEAHMNTSVFKKHTGQTPSEYRKEHGLV